MLPNESYIVRALGSMSMWLYATLNVPLDALHHDQRSVWSYGIDSCIQLIHWHGSQWTHGWLSRPSPQVAWWTEGCLRSSVLLPALLLVMRSRDALSISWSHVHLSHSCNNSFFTESSVIRYAPSGIVDILLRFILFETSDCVISLDVARVTSQIPVLVTSLEVIFNEAN